MRRKQENVALPHARHTLERRGDASAAARAACWPMSMLRIDCARSTWRSCAPRATTRTWVTDSPLRLSLSGNDA
jgi:hypothetical protein